MSPTADGLRLAADRLRSQARVVEDAAGSTRDPGGPETWTGPAADRHRSASAAARIRAGTVADRLRRAATRFDHEADVLLWTRPVEPGGARRSGAQ